jgi:hypothetical protein
MSLGCAELRLGAGTDTSGPGLVARLRWLQQAGVGLGRERSELLLLMAKDSAEAALWLLQAESHAEAAALAGDVQAAAAAAEHDTSAPPQPLLAVRFLSGLRVQLCVLAVYKGRADLLRAMVQDGWAAAVGPPRPYLTALQERLDGMRSGLIAPLPLECAEAVLQVLVDAYGHDLQVRGPAVRVAQSACRAGRCHGESMRGGRALRALRPCPPAILIHGLTGC